MLAIVIACTRRIGHGSAAEGEGATLTGRAVHKYAHQTTAGPRNQPRRTPKSKR